MKEYIAGYSYEDWEKIENEFKRDYANSTKYNKSFRTLIREILDGETDMSFSMKTGLSLNMLSRLRNQDFSNKGEIKLSLIAKSITPLVEKPHIKMNTGGKS